MKWRPIRTAPEKGLLTLWVPYKVKYGRITFGWLCSDLDGVKRWKCLSGDLIEPTYWMPIIKPPQEGNIEGESDA